MIGFINKFIQGSNSKSRFLFLWFEYKSASLPKKCNIMNTNIVAIHQIQAKGLKFINLFFFWAIWTHHELHANQIFNSNIVEISNKVNNQTNWKARGFTSRKCRKTSETLSSRLLQSCLKKRFWKILHTHNEREGVEVKHKRWQEHWLIDKVSVSYQTNGKNKRKSCKLFFPIWRRCI